jgi:hypothetical protein
MFWLLRMMQSQHHLSSGSHLFAAGKLRHAELGKSSLFEAKGYCEESEKDARHGDGSSWLSRLCYTARIVRVLMLT